MCRWQLLSGRIIQDSLICSKREKQSRQVVLNTEYRFMISDPSPDVAPETNDVTIPEVVCLPQYEFFQPDEMVTKSDTQLLIPE